MQSYNPLSFILVLLLIFGCSNPLPSLDQFDAAAWQEDKNGCLNKRSTMAESIQLQKDKLLALNERQVMKLLGKPDQNELYKRNQKFFSYFISPAPGCEASSESSKILVIRFNAMGLAKEVSVE